MAPESPPAISCVECGKPARYPVVMLCHCCYQRKWRKDKPGYNAERKRESRKYDKWRREHRAPGERASEALGVITAEQLEASRHDPRVIALHGRAREHRAELIRQGRLL